ncbi:MAG: hypothetical protein ACRBDL_03995 [Alphaproteobacteria bacterium]
MADQPQSDQVEDNTTTVQGADPYADLRTEFLEKPDILDVTAQKAQANAIIKHAQKHLNVENTDSLYNRVNPDGSQDEALYVNGDTAYALKSAISNLQANNSDLIGIGEDFGRGEVTNNTVKFLDKLIQKQTEKMGINKDSLNETMIHLMAVENGLVSGSPTEDEQTLGKLLSLRNMTSLMANGRLSSGSYYGDDIPSEKPWEMQPDLDNDPDRFFNPETYQSLKATFSVDSSVIFAEGLYEDPQQYQKLIDVAERLGIDPTEQQTLSINQVGEIAKEMMVYEAEKSWCITNSGEDFDPTKINEAIHNGTFLPHLDDLLLVEKGLGVPPELQDTFANATPEEIFRLELDHSSDLQKYRSQQFAESFGSIPDSAIEKAAQIYMHDSSGNQVVPEEEGKAFVSDYMQSPAQFFNHNRLSSSHLAPQKSPYEMDRDKYLETIKNGESCIKPEEECIVNPEDGGGCRTAFDGNAASDQDIDAEITSNQADTGCIVNNECSVVSELQHTIETEQKQQAEANI